MVVQFLLVAHIAVLGYWLGAEFVINSTSRYVVMRTDMPFVERDRLWNHMLNTDQHVRYALILQATLGPMLAALYGLVPGGETTAWAAALVGAAWIGFIEITHHVRRTAFGKQLGKVDRWSRYVLALILVAMAIGVLGMDWAMPLWLRLKLGLFACVILSGVGVRLAVIRHYRTWDVMAREGVTDARNADIIKSYWLATAGVSAIWVFIFSIVLISIVKPQ